MVYVSDVLYCFAACLGFWVGFVCMWASHLVCMPISLLFGMRENECNGICRRRFSATFKATCLSFGQSFTADVVQPILMASAAVPQQDALTTQAEHLAEVSTHSQFLSSDTKFDWNVCTSGVSACR